MSRQIDISNPEKLSDEDRAYLEQRGRPGLLAHLDYMARVNAAAANAVVKKLRQPTEVVETEEVEEPYSEWDVNELRSELRNRKLPAEGKKDELVARLEAHDSNSD